MQRTILFVFSILMVVGLSAQITISNDYFPEAGDSLVTATDAAPTAEISVGSAGANQTWDFSSLQSGGVLVQQFNTAASGAFAADFPGAELRGTLAGGNAEGYYNVTDTELGLIGYAGADPVGQGIQLSAPLNPANVARWAPLAFGDSRTSESKLAFAIAAEDIPGGFLDSIGIDVDSIRISINTDRTDVVDAWGTMDLPVGSYAVLREKRTLMQDVRLEAKVAFLPWFDITDIVGELLPIPEIGQDTSVTYYFWTDAAKEPAAVVTTTSPEDDTPTSVTYKYEAPSSINDPIRPSIALKAFPNPAITRVTFQFADLPLDFYRLEIYNILGQPIQQETYYISGHHTTSLDMSHYKRGMYLYRLFNGQGDVLLTRRLLLARP